MRPDICLYSFRFVFSKNEYLWAFWSSLSGVGGGSLNKKRPRGDSNAQPADIVSKSMIKSKMPSVFRSHWLNKKRPRGDSNAQPTDSKSGTLSIELRGQVGIIIPRFLTECQLIFFTHSWAHSWAHPRGFWHAI